MGSWLASRGWEVTPAASFGSTQRPSSSTRNGQIGALNRIARGARLRRAGRVIFSSNTLAIYTIDRFQEFAEKESHGSREQSSDLQFC